jgi:hypothetical protein
MAIRAKRKTPVFHHGFNLWTKYFKMSFRVVVLQIHFRAYMALNEIWQEKIVV